MKKFYLVLCAMLGIFMASCENESPADPPDTPPETPKVTITFNTDGGSALDPVKIDKGGSLPSDYLVNGSKVPTKTNYKFNGWLNGAAAVTATTKFTTNKTLKAQWLILQVTVVFDLNDDGTGTVPVSISSVIIENSTALEGQYPANPTRKWSGLTVNAFEFLYWYNGTTHYDRNTVIRSTTPEFKLIAEWKDNRIYTQAPAIHPGGNFVEAYPPGDGSPYGITKIPVNEEFTLGKVFSNVDKDAGVLSAQWYRAPTFQSTDVWVGDPVGPVLQADPTAPHNLSLNYTGTETEAGDYWYWVIVTNTNVNATESKTASNRTMNQLKVTFEGGVTSEEGEE